LINKLAKRSLSSSQSDSSTNTERTKIIYGSQNVIGAVLQFASKTKIKIDACIDHTRPMLFVEIKPLTEAFLAAKRRGVKLRYITEVTAENIAYAKQLIAVVDELRHLDEFKGNFYISESEYLTPTAFHEKGKPATQIICSNVEELVENQEYVFDALWNKAISAEQRIREIEEGIEPEFFEVFTDNGKVTQILIDVTKSAKKEVLMLLANDKSMVRMATLGVIDYVIRVSQENVTVKIICPLSEENSEIVKRISEQAPSIKILNGNNSLNEICMVDRKKFLRTELKETNSSVTGFAIYSNSKGTVDSFRMMFELLWNERTINEEVKKTHNMQKEFINIASHELRTPTQAILGYCELYEIDHEFRQETMRSIHRNAERLQRLNDYILDVTRIESNTLRLVKERFDLNEIIRDLVNDFKTQIANKNNNKSIDLRFGEPNKSIVIYADKVRISEVISNLLNNAIKFTERKGTITLWVKEKELVGDVEYKEIIVRIKDTGSGIDPDIHRRLFSKFAANSQTGGTGLGLFISKSVVEAHGGRIWAEDNTDERGTTFSFSLPIE